MEARGQCEKNQYYISTGFYLSTKKYKNEIYIKIEVTSV